MRKTCNYVYNISISFSFSFHFWPFRYSISLPNSCRRIPFSSSDWRCGCDLWRPWRQLKVPSWHLAHTRRERLGNEAVVTETRTNICKNKYLEQYGEKSADGSYSQRCSTTYSYCTRIRRELRLYTSRGTWYKFASLSIKWVYRPIVSRNPSFNYDL